MDFLTFLLLNAVLYVRPQELVPVLYGLPLYNVAFFVCLIASLPCLLAEGNLRSSLGHPVGVCLLSIAIISILTNLAAGRVQMASNAADLLSKSLLYYVLMSAILRTPTRLKWFLASLVVDTCIVSAFSLAHYKGIYTIPTLSMVEEVKVVGDEVVFFQRLGSTGLFHDPNDMGLLIAGGIILSVYLIGDRSAPWPLRAVWVAVLPLLGQALNLTYSRAGMLTLLVGLGIYVAARSGRRAVIAIGLALPVVLSLGGRQMDLSLSGGSGQARVHLWDMYFGFFMSNPLLGVGFDYWAEAGVQVAHNSYLHAYGEMGFAGGTAFLSAFILGLWSLARSSPARAGGGDPELSRQWPFLMAAVGCYAVGIMSLTRCNVIPTYTILGLVVVHSNMTSARSPREPLRLGPRVMVLLVGASIAYLAVMHVVIRRNASYY